MSASEHEILVPPLSDPRRVDRFLAECGELDISRSRLQQLIAEGKVTVDGSVVNKRYLLKGGERVTVLVMPAPEANVAPQDIPFGLVYHDEHIAVIDKPPGLVVHPAKGNPDRTLVNGLVYRLGPLATAGGDYRPGIVHRLDKDTSGLMVVARSDRAYLALREAIQERKVQRTYLALVCGHVSQDKGMIDLPIGRSPRDRTLMAVTANSGRPAETEYELLERYRSYDLLRVELRTGRTHQIRVHLSHLGHPVFGDPEYGGREKWHRGMFGPERPLARRLLAIMPRQALLAARLRFQHPITGEPLDFECEPPEDFRTVLEALKSEGR